MSRDRENLSAAERREYEALTAEQQQGYRSLRESSVPHDVSIATVTGELPDYSQPEDDLRESPATAKAEGTLEGAVLVLNAAGFTRAEIVSIVDAALREAGAS